MKTNISAYAPYIIESIREKLGYDMYDDSHDDEVIEYLSSGKKMSKSDMTN